MLPYWDCISWSTIPLNAYSLIVCIPFNFSRFRRSSPTSRLTSTFRYFDRILRYGPSVLTHDCAELDRWKLGDALLSIPKLIPLLLWEVENVGGTIVMAPNQVRDTPYCTSSWGRAVPLGIVPPYSSAVHGCWSLYTMGYTSHVTDHRTIQGSRAAPLGPRPKQDDYLDCGSSLNVIWSIVDSRWLVGLLVSSRLALIWGSLCYFSFGFVCWPVSGYLGNNVWGWFVRLFVTSRSALGPHRPCCWLRLLNLFGSWETNAGSPLTVFDCVWVSEDRRRVLIDHVWLCFNCVFWVSGDRRRILIDHVT